MFGFVDRGEIGISKRGDGKKKNKKEKQEKRSGRNKTSQTPHLPQGRSNSDHRRKQKKITYKKGELLKTFSKKKAGQAGRG